jgi:integrase/recombinase XerD
VAGPVVTQQNRYRPTRGRSAATGNDYGIEPFCPPSFLGPDACSRYWTKNRKPTVNRLNLYYSENDMMNRMGNSVRNVNRQLHPPTEAAESPPSTSLIYDRAGNRKYLTATERCAFLRSVDTLSPEVRTFCRVLAYTGARVSECLALTPGRIDISAKLVVLESLKKRRRGVFRAIPLPDELLADLRLVHALADHNGDPEIRNRRLWPWCRTFAWLRVKEGMALAHVVGPQASPKGLRHAFAVTALQSGIPINLVRRWLGHSRLSTTEIYADAIGPEERAIAGRLWESF